MQLQIPLCVIYKIVFRSCLGKMKFQVYSTSLCRVYVQSYMVQFLDVKRFSEEKKMKAHTGSKGPVRAGPTWWNPRWRTAIMVDQTVVHVLLVLPRHLCMMHNQYGQHGQKKRPHNMDVLFISVHAFYLFKFSV